MNIRMVIGIELILADLKIGKSMRIILLVLLVFALIAFNFDLTKRINNE